jgi:hypothetical protein
MSALGCAAGHTPPPARVAVHTVAETRTSRAAPARTPYEIAESLVPTGEFSCFAWIIQTGSGWDVTADNASSGAYGLGQALPATRMASYGADYLTDATTQLRWALSYMDARYGSPCLAKAFHLAHGWY